MHRTTASLKKEASSRHIGRVKEDLAASYMPFVTALGGLVSGKTETAGNVSDMVGTGELLKEVLVVA